MPPRPAIPTPAIPSKDGWPVEASGPLPLFSHRSFTFPESTPMTLAHAYAAQSATTPLAPFTFERREPAARDVAIDILYCGVCHSDLHTVRSEWGAAAYPCVPGHEIVGR